MSSNKNTFSLCIPLMLLTVTRPRLNKLALERKTRINIKPREMGNLFCKPCYQKHSRSKIASIRPTTYPGRENEICKCEICHYDRGHYDGYDSLILHSSGSQRPCAGSTFSSSPLNWEIASEETHTFYDNNVTNTVPSSSQKEKVTS